VANMRQPLHAKERADEIADLISAAGEKLVELSGEWFELNDRQGLAQARQMLNANEVTLMLSAHLRPNGLAHIALNLLRTETDMPRPYFEVQVPMLKWALRSANDSIEAAKRATDRPFMGEQRGKKHTGK
jgi:hypothetical protein